MRHLPALLVFIAACVAVAWGLGLEGTGLLGYVLLCICFVLPLSASIYAYVRSSIELRALHRAPEDALPPGVSWVFPGHRPGGCRSPETPPDAMVAD